MSGIDRTKGGTGPVGISVPELRKLEVYLRGRLRSPEIHLSPHAQQKEMAELRIGREFFGTVYRDAEDGEVNFVITITILPEDLS